MGVNNDGHVLALLQGTEDGVENWFDEKLAAKFLSFQRNDRDRNPEPDKSKYQVQVRALWQALDAIQLKKIELGQPLDTPRKPRDSESVLADSFRMILAETFPEPETETRRHGPATVYQFPMTEREL